MGGPKVSVLVPCYNHSAYVEQTIHSILEQSFNDYELIVIDDGSTDDSPDILSVLAERYGFSYQRQSNQGLVRTLNALVAKSSGEYITICASDDYWPTDRLAEQVELLDSNPDVALVHGVPSVVDRSGTIVRPARFAKEDMLDGRGAYRDMAWRRRKFQTTTIMVRASVYEALGGYDIDIPVEDIDFMFRVTRTYPILASERVWNYYRKHGDNWTMTSSGGRRLISSEWKVALKLGWPLGVIFLFTGMPVWFQITRRSGLPSRFLYLLLFPIYFWHKTYLKQFASLLLGKSGSQRATIG